MGGSGGGYFPSRPDRLHSLIEKARESAEQQRLDTNIHGVLQDLLTTFNERDSEKIQEYLSKIKEILGKTVEVETLLFGGSVAKHTYVDGLSDVDALIILDREDLAGQSPEEVLNIFHKSLQDQLTYDKVKSVEKGSMAVTVIYRDGTEIQLLPAIHTGGKVFISSTRSKEWNETNPKAFQRALTKANQGLNSALVPTIKLIKSINDGLPEQKRLMGYHIESLAVEAAKRYHGAKTVKGLLTHTLEHASKRVLSPIRDVTAQSRTVDSYLGKARSTKRRVIADALASIVRKLDAATSADQWKTIVEG